VRREVVERSSGVQLGDPSGAAVAQILLDAFGAL
jgi:hypothetical protein